MRFLGEKRQKINATAKMKAINQSRRPSGFALPLEAKARTTAPTALYTYRPSQVRDGVEQATARATAHGRATSHRAQSVRKVCDGWTRGLPTVFASSVDLISAGLFRQLWLKAKAVVWVLREWTPPTNLGPATTIQFLDEPSAPEDVHFGEIR